MPSPIDIAAGVSIWKVDADRLLPAGVRVSIEEMRDGRKYALSRDRHLR